MEFLTSLIAASATSPTTFLALEPRQLVQFRRPCPRGGKGLCRGIVVSVAGGSVVVRCTVSTVIGLPVGAQLRLTAWEVSPVPRNPLSAAVPPATAATLREPVLTPAEAPGPRNAPTVPAPAGLDATEMFADPVERSAARAAFAPTQQPVATAALTSKYVSARLAMTNGAPKGLNYLSVDGAFTLWVTHRGNPPQHLSWCPGRLALRRHWPSCEHGPLHGLKVPLHRKRRST